MALMTLGVHRDKAVFSSGYKFHAATAPANCQCRRWVAGSTDRRNTGIKSLRRGFKLQGLSWPFVELTRYFVEMSLRVHR
jgi:hypothetical protein